MNERIKELAEQANGVVINKMMTGAKQYTFLEQDLEKFAELIVKECVSQMEWQKISPKEVGPYNSALSLAQRNIKEHFGVEQ